MSEENESLHFLEGIDIDAIVKYLNDTDDVICDERETKTPNDTKSITQDFIKCENTIKNVNNTKEINNIIKIKNKKDESIPNENVDNKIKDIRVSKVYDEPITNIIDNANIKSTNQNTWKTDSDSIDNSSIIKHGVNTLVSQKEEVTLLETLKNAVDKNKSGTTKKIITINKIKCEEEKVISTLNTKENKIDKKKESIECLDQTIILSEDIYEKIGFTPQKVHKPSYEIIKDNIIKNNIKVDINCIKDSKHFLDLISTKETLKANSLTWQQSTKKIIQIIDDTKDHEELEIKETKKLKHSKNLPSTKETFKEKGIMLQKVPTHKSEDIKHINVLNSQKNNTDAQSLSPSSVILRKSDLQLSKNLEKQLYEQLHLKFTDLSIIHYGKYSKIFKSKQGGKEYAIKIINENLNIKRLGLEKEEMLSNIQYNIPKYQLFCVYLIASFELEKSWCFMFDYYPKNLKYELKLNGPMHIDRVQNLSRQLLTALNTLRTQNIIHSSFSSMRIVMECCENIVRNLNKYYKNSRFFMSDFVSTYDLIPNNMKLSHAIYSILLLLDIIFLLLDIKPEHILLDHANSTLKLCGFDNSYYIADVNMLPNIGTASYRAPEIILGYSAAFSIDIWSTSLVMYEMATNQKLFPGCFNNDILYKQMCILGNMPLDMIRNSIYGCNHFLGARFIKREGYRGQYSTIINHDFSATDIFKTKPHTVYKKYWGYAANKTERDLGIEKIGLLVSLLEKMIVLHPQNRITIEYIYDDPFMYHF